MIQVIMMELEPCSEYEIMISAINQFGNSACSETIIINTPGLRKLQIRQSNLRAESQLSSNSDLVILTCISARQFF